MDWLTIRTHDGLHALSSQDLEDFTFDGDTFRLKDRQAGIWKPRQLEAALSIQTTWRARHEDRPYDDATGPDGLMRYKWRGDDPHHSHNRALRTAMERELPLIWFWGVGAARYQAVFPVYLVAEEPAHQQFVVTTDGLQHLPAGSEMEEATRRYVRSETERRLHQPVFRSMIMRAYEARCAICSLRHLELLDAAHIVEDRHELGIAAVSNGLALCKIHHAAYDADILGVNPDLRVEIRDDVLHEVDGPMLQHGLKDLHGHRIRTPRRRHEHPRKDLLELRYERFRMAG